LISKKEESKSQLHQEFENENICYHLIGVVHMTLGVLVKATNSLYYKRKVEFWFETIPQLIFLVLVFGYMDFLIMFKWLKPWGYGNVHAPSIITSMINLPLMVGKTVNFYLIQG